MKKLNYFFLILFFLGITTVSSAQKWTQIGTDINGEAKFDQSGSSVSLSSDGSIVAIGAMGNDENGDGSGHVRIYQNNAGTWTQIGDDINGEAESDISGYSVSLSSDGSIVAIGAIRNDGNGTDAGHVRIYQNIEGTWTQIGADIDGEAAGDESGSSVSLNSNGSVVAISAYKNAGNGTDAGHVRIYQNIEGTWTQIGADIDGEAAGDKSGFSVSLSSDGSRVAIGAIGNNGSASFSGHVRIYQNIEGTWTQIGTDIDGEAEMDQSGASVSLSFDGAIVAIGASGNDGNGSYSGHVRIYQNIGETWTQIGTDIDGEAAGDESGSSVSLNSDGSVVAIGACINAGNGTGAGHVRIYQNIDGSWTQTGTDIDGEAAGDNSGVSVSLSSDGSVVAIGAHLNDGNDTDAGHVRIYQDIPIWTQIGTDIDGEAAGDESGYSVSLSSDGSTVAIGAYLNDGSGGTSTDAGHVRIYKNTAGTWTQIGDDIDGENFGDESGYSVSLSSDGSIVAIGAYINIGDGNYSGHVRVYQNIDETWTQIGADIVGEAASDFSGWSVSLSSEGATVAIGAYRNDGSGGTSADAGHVRIYQNIAGTWTQIGADLDGDEASDFFGHSVSLSSNGLIVAIGAYGNDQNGSRSGHVRIYQNNAGTWTQIGTDIEGESTGDESGYSVCLSSDGSVVAIGAQENDGSGTDAGHVRIYQNISSTWTQIGADIDGEAASDSSGVSVSLSSDGSIVAIGANGNDGNGTSTGHVRIYQNIEGTWTQIEEDIDGEAASDASGISVSLSFDGSVAAIGGHLNDGNGTNAGHVRVYRFQRPPTIVSQPENQTNICPGTVVNFSVKGYSINTYQWQVSTDGGDTWSDLSDNATYAGAVTDTLTVISDISLNNYQYHCYVKNGYYGNATSDVSTLSFETEDPVITCISNQEVDADDTHTYTVAGTEFNPVNTDDNCGVSSVINDFNSLVTLDGASLPEGTTTIVWTVTDAAGNDAECSFDVQINAFVGIETIQQNGISIYPNPTNGIINFEFAENNIQQIKISDISGKMIIEKTAIQQNETIDLTGFESGVYIISIQTDKEIFAIKIVKE